MFEHVIAALVHGSGYERVASAGCLDRTIRRRLRAWADAGLGEQVHELTLDAYDRMIGGLLNRRSRSSPYPGHPVTRRAADP